MRESNSYAKNVADNGRMIDGIDRALAYLAEMYSVSWRLDDGNTYLDDGYLIGVEDGEVFVAA